jgi:hypothetical protein
MANIMRQRSAQVFAWSIGLVASSTWRQTMRKQLWVM